MKNGHNPSESAIGGYVDRMFNLQFTGETAVGTVSLVAEVQILLTAMVHGKKKMHVCYRVARGDFSPPGVDLGFGTPQSWDPNSTGDSRKLIRRGTIRGYHL